MSAMLVLSVMVLASVAVPLTSLHATGNLNVGIGQSGKVPSYVGGSGTYNSMVMTTDTIYGIWGQEIAHESDSFDYTWAAKIYSSTWQTWSVDTMYGGSADTYTNGGFVSYNDYTGGVYLVVSQWVVPNSNEPRITVYQFEYNHNFEWSNIWGQSCHINYYVFLYAGTSLNKIEGSWNLNMGSTTSGVIIATSPPVLFGD